MKPRSKRLQSSDDDDSPKKPKLDDEDDGSSSDSSIGEYLKPADEIDLNSEFFQVKKEERMPSFYAIERNILSGVTCLEEEESDDETDKKIINSEIQTESIAQKPSTSLVSPAKSEKPNLQKLQKVKKKTKSKKKLEEEPMDILNLLAIGEAKGKTEEFSDMNDSDHSELGNWEEVEHEEEKAADADNPEIAMKEGVQITVKLPSLMHKKKGVDLMAAIKRRLNRRKKEIQVLMHQVHLLSWLAHGNFVNPVLNNADVFGMALSLLPSEQCYPPERTDLNYLENITRWYMQTIKLVEKPDKGDLSLADRLKLQISKKEANSKKNLVFIFVCMLRSLGIQCRVVFNFATVPLRPPSSELCSLSTKQEEGDNKAKVKSEKVKAESADVKTETAKKESPKLNASQLNASKGRASKKRVSFTAETLNHKKVATPTKSKPNATKSTSKAAAKTKEVKTTAAISKATSEKKVKSTDAEKKTQEEKESQKKTKEASTQNVRKTTSRRKTEVPEEKTVVKKELATKTSRKQKNDIDEEIATKKLKTEDQEEKKSKNAKTVAAKKSNAKTELSKQAESKRKLDKLSTVESNVVAQEMKRVKEENATKKTKIEIIQTFSKEDLQKERTSGAVTPTRQSDVNRRRSKSVAELKAIAKKVPEPKKTKSRRKSTAAVEELEKQETAERPKATLASLLKKLKPPNAKAKKPAPKVDKNQNPKQTKPKNKKTAPINIQIAIKAEGDETITTIPQVDGPADDEEDDGKQPSTSVPNKPNIRKLRTVEKAKTEAPSTSSKPNIKKLKKTAVGRKGKEASQTKEEQSSVASTSKPNIRKLKAASKTAKTLVKREAETKATKTESNEAERSRRQSVTAVKYAEADEQSSDDDFMPPSPRKSLCSTPVATSSRHFASPRKRVGVDVRDDIVQLLKKRIAEQKHIDRSKLAKGAPGRYTRRSDDEDSDFVPEEIPKKEAAAEDSDDDFDAVAKKRNAKKRNSTGKPGGVKVKRRVQPLKSAAAKATGRPAVSSDSEAASESPTKKTRKGNDVWLEVFLEAEEQWISVDVIMGKVHCVSEIHARASTPVAYIVAWNNDNTIKDVTRRYCPLWNTVTRKLRIDNDWWLQSLKPYLGIKNARDREEDEELMKQQLEQPLPKTVSEYKNHPLYVLKRHLLKFQAIYPPEPMTLGFIRGEPVYARECVHTLHSREIWVKHAKVVRLGEQPYKIVKARPKYDKLSGSTISDKPLEIFGPWQVDDYVPPTAENGVVPRNAYGNVELFKACMLPKGTVHLQLPGLNKTARKMNIDCAPAVVGFDFHSGFSHPTFDGFVVCEEFSEKLVEAYLVDQEEQTRKEQEKYEKRVYGNWRRLIRGLFIRERLKIKYYGDQETADEAADVASTSAAPAEDKKKGKRPLFWKKKSTE